ncbi:MAG: tetratricopeptide repeat protein [Muribaculaceae bacterium]|nr:tetratricopeptide repeat protein [Muribaculaceae bacterium]
MKFKYLFAFGLAAASLSAMAQTHAEGVEYYEADQLNNAKELLQRNLNNPGTDKAIAFYYQGMIALRNGNENEAAKLFEQGLQANPDYAFNYIGLGQIDLKANAPKVAETNFKKAESLAKKNPAVFVALARAYDAVNPDLYAKEIEKNLNKARKISLEDPNSYIFEGDRLARNKDWGQAGAKYEMAITYDPNATAAYVKYANLFTQVNPQYSINMLRKLLQVNPQSALGQRELANAYYNNKQYKEAAEEYGKYVNNPNHFKQDEDRFAFLLFYDGKYNDGYKYATQLLQKDPNNFSAMRYQLMNAAQDKSLADQLLPMAEKLWKAQQADPANRKFAPIDYILISQEFQTAKRYEDAMAVLNDAMTAMPDNASFPKELSMVYVGLNDMVGASEAYDKYMALNPETGYNDYIQAAIFAMYAGVQDKADKPAEADAYFEKAANFANKAATILPDNYKPVKTIGDIELQKASKENAESAAAPKYLEAIALLEAAPDPSRYTNDAKTMYNYVGNYYLSQNNKADAKKYFQKYLELDPNNEQYRKFVNGL